VTARAPHATPWIEGKPSPLNANDFLQVRLFIAHLRPDQKLSQHQMAALLGVACNTYSKWERGYQPPPPFACRAVELLLYVTLANKGHFKGESHAMALLARFTRDAGKGEANA